MTISTTIIKNSYNGTGSQDVFPYTFKITANADIQVIIRSNTGVETVKNLTTHYTVSGAGDASGGNVTFTSGNIPTNTETVVIRRNTTQTQGLDLVENDPFTANSVEGAFDKNLAIIQELQEQLDRSFKISRTNSITSTEIGTDATTRANKVFSFNSSGEIALDQELGIYKGNWAASTTYPVRSLVKDTSNNNIYLCNTAHTSSGSQPISSNTDVAKWDLLVDAAAAATSASAASTSATNAASSATAAASSASAASTSATSAAYSATAAANSASSSASQATSAASEATSAAASFDSFDDIYLGVKSTEPSTDNDGDALTEGDMYFNSSDGKLKIYSGGQWKDAAVDTSSFAQAGFSIAMAVAL